MANGLDVVNCQNVNVHLNLFLKSEDNLENIDFSKIPTSGGFEYSSQYHANASLSYDQKITTFPSHYYYNDYQDIKNIETVTTVKEINLIKETKRILQSIDNPVSQNRMFMNCCAEEKKKIFFEFRKCPSSCQKKTPFHEFEDNDNFSSVHYLNIINSHLDSMNKKYLLAKTIIGIQENQYYNVLDLKDICKINFFHSPISVSGDTYFKR